ncbi:MAG: hypothetical protein E6F99_20265 [Actinobacteria bacterium]|nr:MAG: hypothetical protein E6F99_20265 [Actinomycetota bacterium]
MNHQFARLVAPHRPRAAATPAYVERGGELVTRQPFVANGVSMSAFAVPADRDLLTGMCERMFTVPTGGAERYSPVGGHVLIVFATIEEMRSSERPDSLLGMCTERELAVWVPLHDDTRGRFVWTIPYIFVDSPAPLLGGREIYGFPKRLAELTVNEDESAFEVRTLAIDRFASDARLQMHQIAAARRLDGEVADGASWNRLADAHEHFRGLGAVLDAAGPAGRFLLSFDGAGVPVVLLKQFRDARDPSRACYQAVVEVVHEIRGFRGGRVLEDWEVCTASLDGLPLERELGIIAGSHKPQAAFRIDVDFEIGLGRVLWEAGP